MHTFIFCCLSCVYHNTCMYLFVTWFKKSSASKLHESLHESWLSITLWCLYPHGTRGWGLGAFLMWWLPSTMCAGPQSIYGCHQGCLNNPIFSNLGLCAACCTHFMCHHELWPTSVSHPFSSLNNSLDYAGGKHYLPLLSLSLDLFFKILLFHVTFLIFFSIAIFSPYFPHYLSV